MTNSSTYYYYWTLIKINAAGNRQVQSIPSAETFFNQVFAQLIDVLTANNKDIQLQLLNLYGDTSDDKSVNAQRCLLCFISWEIEKVCLNLEKQFGISGGFTSRDLLPYVLDDDGRLQWKSSYQCFSLKILQSFDVNQSSLSSWTNRKVRQRPALSKFLLECGIYLLSDWAILNDTQPKQLERILSQFHSLTVTEIQQNQWLLASYHAVYRAQRLQQRQSGKTRKCQPPTISLQLPVQSWLLEKRILAQAVYRQLTNQIDTKSTPPVLLVQIDNKSINKAGILNPRPINREYMAQIIDKLVESKASVIGIDYLLDRPDKNRDTILSNFIKTGLTSSQPTRFVFATTRDSQGDWLTVHPQIASEKWSLAGEIEVLPGWYMQLLPSRNSNPKPRPFASLLALAQQLKQLPNSPQPQLKSKQDFWQQINTYVNNNPSQSTILSSKRTRLQSLTAFSYYLGQMWLHPIIDFSVPPKQVYQTIPAWKLLENKEIISPEQIIIVAPGGYGEAGTVTENEDNFELPAATGFWKNQDNPDNTRGVLTGGGVHAYMTHHYLNNAMVIPIPDLWMIGLAILLSKITSIYLRNNPEQVRKKLVLLSVSSAIYSLISLQLYISSAAILLPWLLPTITFWFYALRAFSKKNIYYE